VTHRGVRQLAVEDGYATHRAELDAALHSLASGAARYFATFLANMKPRRLLSNRLLPGLHLSMQNHRHDFA